MIEALQSVMQTIRPAAIALSGGVDSMTLAHVAHGVGPVQMFHAVSPAVPPRATERVRDHAAQEIEFALRQRGESSPVDANLDVNVWA